jgi:glycosyltransferase involved in cell wall biosynthesis
MKVLWLTSWYPNPYEPVNGDFVQRHAQAVAQYLPIDVIHVVQLGKDKTVETIAIKYQQNKLQEFIYTFTFNKVGISWIDKIRYNLAYQKFYLQIVEQYIQENGKPNLIHVHVPMKAGLIALALKKKYQIPFIVSEQASYYESASPDNFNKRSYFFRKNTQTIFQQAITATNVSATISKVIQQKFGLSKVHCVHNVVDVQLFQPKKNKSNNIFNWVHVSTLGEQKNITGLLTAFAIVKQQCGILWQLTLVGPNVQPHVATVQSLQLQQEVIFVGEAKHTNVPNYLQQAQAFVMFSRHENFPCVIPEALCCGLPVIASNVGGVAEAINKSNGIVVASNNTTELAAAIIHVMENYGSYNANLIAEAATAKYSMETIGKQFLSIYQQVI